MKMLTQRQEDALVRHKKKSTHTRKHMEEMKKLMLNHEQKKLTYYIK